MSVQPKTFLDPAEAALTPETVEYSGLLVIRFEFLAFHEAGHYVVAESHGAWGVHSGLHGSGRAWTEAHGLPLLHDAVMIAAGDEATNMIYGLNEPTNNAGDGEMLAEACEKLTMDPSEIVEIARVEVRELESEIRAVAAALYRKGHH